MAQISSKWNACQAVTCIRRRTRQTSQRGRRRVQSQLATLDGLARALRIANGTLLQPGHVAVPAVPALPTVAHLEVRTRLALPVCAAGLAPSRPRARLFACLVDRSLRHDATAVGFRRIRAGVTMPLLDAGG